MAKSKFVSIGLCVLLSIVLGSAVGAQTEQRPISEFLDAQSNVPPVSLTFWWDPTTDNTLGFDAFAKVNEYRGLNLPTSISGSLKVHHLADGRSHVTVVLHTRDALCFGWAGEVFVFGQLPAWVGAGERPALGDGMLRLEFTMPSDAPMPDYDSVWSEPYELDFIAQGVDCRGDFREASGYPDGTPAKAHTTQTGLLMTGVPSGCPPERDANCFPVEIVTYKPIGNWK